MLAETLKLPRLESLESFNVSPRRFPWHTVKHIDNEKQFYGLINSHHGKRVLFVMLWVFALYFDNYHWKINDLLATEISKLQLIIALYVVHIWLIVFILTSYTLSSLRLGHHFNIW